ncbi:MAG: DMT family transporter [Clostridia bacterium]|nr:DMT family transporter [Clostridia bacterium]
MKKSLSWGYLAVIASACLYGCMPLLTKFIYADGVGVLTAVLMRNVLAMPVLGILAKCSGQQLKVPGKALLRIGVAGILGSCLTSVPLFASYNYISSGTATVLHFVYPALTVVAGVLFLRQRASVGTLLGVVACMAGLAMFYDPGQPLAWQGVALALASGVAYTAYILCLAAFPYKNITGFSFGFWLSIVNTVLLLAVCLVSGNLTLPQTLTGWILSLILALVTYVGAMVLFLQGTRMIGGQRAAILSTLEPIVSVIVGAAVFHEYVGVRTVIGSVLVLSASVLIAIFDAKKK